MHRIRDHKFDYIDVDDFIDDSWTRKFQYSFLFFLTLKSVLVYTADITLLAFLIQGGALDPNFTCAGTKDGINVNATNAINQIICNVDKESISYSLAPFKARPWIMLASIIMSFALLVWDYRKGAKVIDSRDIAMGLTNHVAYRYYTLKSYPHYCFFQQILESRTFTDKVAFFVYFTFKSWKRLFLAEFPRVYVNALNLYDLCNKKIPVEYKYSNPIVQFFYAFIELSKNKVNDPTGFAALLLTAFSLAMWFISFCAIVIAFFTYFPLLNIIRGNLKEYVCHKVDKRITEILARKKRERTHEARQAELRDIEAARRNELRMEAMGNTGVAAPVVTAPLGLTQRPTLPAIDVDLDAPDNQSNYSGSGYGTIGRSNVVPVQYVGYGGQPHPPQPMYGQVYGGPNSVQAPHPAPPGRQGAPPPNGPPPFGTGSIATPNYYAPNGSIASSGNPQFNAPAIGSRSDSGEPLIRREQ
ncbi:hypothetical protein HDU79_006967 [Rhizoclosmatium sp. JEL0117]|nr:hypothetical protein HDU79_006967 [Rhizoclosmatium sp. JEL0117]